MPYADPQKQREYFKKRARTPKYRAMNNRALKKYRKTVRGRMARAIYRKTPKAKATARRGFIRRTYGLAAEPAKVACAICGNIHHLVIDHDHVTGNRAVSRCALCLLQWCTRGAR